MEYNNLQMVSWNLNGASDKDRVRVVRQWLKDKPNVGIIGFQELKATEFKAESGMRSIFSDGRAIIDFNESKGKGGAALRLKGDTMEYARLDRIYMSEGTDWIDSIENIHHDGRSALSDHYPVILNLKMEQEKQERQRWRTYFKCRIEEVKRQGVLQELESVWRNNPKTVTDPRIKWELGWSSIKKVLQRVRRETKLCDKPLESLQEKLMKAREEIAKADTSYNRAKLGELEKHVKSVELKEAAAWRLRSLARWLREGDAPTHYFFALMKSKFKREQITSLTLDNGDTIEEPKEILREAHRFYQDLFTNDARGANMEEETEQCLHLLKNQVQEGENVKLVGKPDEAEIERTVNLLPTEKGPCLDGITVELVENAGR
ncbi:hypothetical protein R1sor_009707 [Riccia sorocarpa]|uniref:Endonuclease/exonuclease/phosphatase domain-containing protein n=1 Tax=Riccia sorocarpa TaxID=122646 RepID=A0ABD3HXN9_9MARC